MNLLKRVFAMILRHYYLLSTSWPRVLELIYWPTLNLMVWGFMQQFLSTRTDLFANAGGILVSAILLWDCLFRSQLGVTLSFIEEFWSRNLVNLSVSPLRPAEMILALLATSFIRTSIGVGGATIIAYYVFDFTIVEEVIAFGAYFFNLMIMGWSLGLIICAVLMKYGLAAESLAWAALFLVQPLCGVFYPIDVLPVWLQYFSYIFPATYIFEGMREIFFNNNFVIDLLVNAIFLNLLYVFTAIIIFLKMNKHVRKSGSILLNGE